MAWNTFNSVLCGRNMYGGNGISSIFNLSLKTISPVKSLVWIFFFKEPYCCVLCKSKTFLKRKTIANMKLEDREEILT